MLSLRFGICQRKLIRTLSGHSGAVTSVVFSPDGRTLISGSKDKDDQGLAAVIVNTTVFLTLRRFVT